MLLWAVGSLHEYPMVLHFTLGETTYPKPRPSQTVSSLLSPNPWLREGIFRKGDLKGLCLILSFGDPKTLTDLTTPLPAHPTAPLAHRPCRGTWDFFFFIQRGHGFKRLKIMVWWVHIVSMRVMSMGREAWLSYSFCRSFKSICYRCPCSKSWGHSSE